MKKVLLLAAFAGLTCYHSHAQKLMTRTGKVSFFSTTQIENIEAFNNEVAGVLDTKTGEVMFIVPIKSFKFEKALMQEHFNENYMESDKFPKAEFKGKTDLSAVNFTKDGSYKVKAIGKLTMHGVTKDVSTPGTVVVKAGTATVNTKFTINPADYGIKIPSVASSKISNKIEITVDTNLKGK